MKLAVIPLLLLSACTTYEVVEVPTTTATPVAPQIATRKDPAASVLLQCDHLGFPRYSDTHRLCVMRGVDRLAVDLPPVAPPLVVPQSAPIQILPYPYPPLAPRGGNVRIIP